jgi:hypothetical protein
LLPKFIDVAITIGFLETDSISDYYGYEKSDTAKQQTNEDSSADTISQEPRTEATTVNRVESTGFANPSPVMTSLNGNKSKTPNESENSLEPSLTSQAKQPNSASGKTTEQKISEAETSLGLSRAQARRWVTSLQIREYKHEKNLAGKYNINAGDAVFTKNFVGSSDKHVVVVSSKGSSRSFTSKN